MVTRFDRLGPSITPLCPRTGKECTIGCSALESARLAGGSMDTPLKLKTGLTAQEQMINYAQTLSVGGNGNAGVPCVSPLRRP